MRYPNGRVPLSELVHINGSLYMFPGTYRRWLTLVDLVQRRHGVTLRVTRGTESWNDWNGYRLYDAQVVYKQKLPEWAAKPGYSSHGGTYGARESGAIDVANWASIGWENFKKAGEECGFTMLIDPREKWHIVDFQPWSIPSGSGQSNVPNQKPKPIQEDEDMAKYLRTKQHGIYNVVPGAVISIGNPRYLDSLVYIADTNGTPRPNIIDVAPDDLAEFIFNESGCPKSQIPAPNYAWYAALNPTS